MLATRLLKWSSFLLGVVIVGAQTAHPESYCTLQWGKLSIGTVERNPFSADVRITSWQISLDGKKKQMNPLIVFHVARDRDGRVAINGPLFYGGDSSEPYLPGDPKSQERWGDQSSSQMILCDPLSDTATSYRTSMNHHSDQKAWIEPGSSIPGLTHNRIYNRTRMAKNGKWVDLGYAGFGGIEAHGYRWWLERDSDGAFVEEDFTEQWIADDLASELSVVTTDKKHTHEERTELTNIRRTEMDPSMFQIPKDYEVLRRDVTPSRPGQSPTK
jgi:hypothetical protein